MRSPARSLLALIAALALLLNLTGLVAAARDASTGSGPGLTSYMAALGSHGGDARGKPGGGGVKNLQSNGGAVQQTPRVYISYWGPEWNTAGAPTATHTYADAMTYNTGFFANVGGSAWNQVVTQYCMGVPRRTTTCPSGATFITNPSGQMWGAWVDTTAVPSSPSQAQIAAAAQRLADHFGVSAADYANATFMVYTPSGKSMSGFAATGGNWCAWHSSTTYKGAQFAYAYIPYLPDAGSLCGQSFVNAGSSGYFDGFSIVAGHEYSEAETDPFPSGGWLDRSGQENADKCAWHKNSGNIHLGSRDYAVQPTWDNSIGGCPSVS